MKFSVFTAMMTKFSVKEIIKLVSNAGFDAIEWGVGYPNLSEEDAYKEAEAIKMMGRDAGLAVSSVSGGPKFDETERIKKIIDIAHRLECSQFRVVVPWYGFTREEQSAHTYWDLFNRSIEQLGVIEEICRKEQVKALLETHFGNICASPSLAHNLVKNFDNRHIGIIYDPGNMVIEGMESPKMALEIIGGHLAHVHVKNAIWGWIDKDWLGNPIPEGWNWKFTRILEGIIKWDNILKLLIQSEYSGYLSWEDFSESSVETKLSDIGAFRKLTNYI